MRVAVLRPTTSVWPFWLLLAAWVLANIPQGVSYVAVVWVGEGKAFSHQQRLMSDVIKLLDGGETAPLFAAMPDLPAPSKSAPAPAEPSLKKFELAVEFGCEALASKVSVIGLISALSTESGSGRAAPPVEPPRVVAIV